MQPTIFNANACGNSFIFLMTAVHIVYIKLNAFSVANEHYDCNTQYRGQQHF